MGGSARTPTPQYISVGRGGKKLNPAWVAEQKQAADIAAKQKAAADANREQIAAAEKAIGGRPAWVDKYNAENKGAYVIFPTISNGVLEYQRNDLAYFDPSGKFLRQSQTGDSGFNILGLLGGVALSFLLPGVGSAIAAELVSAGVVTAGATAEALGTAIASTVAGVAQGQSLDKALTNAVVGAAVNTGSIEVAKAVNDVIGHPAVTDAIVSAGASAVKSAAAGGSEEDAAKAALSNLVSSGTTSAVKNALDVSPNTANIIGAGAGGAVAGGTAGAITSALSTAASQLGTPTPTPAPTPSVTTSVASTDPIGDINKIIEQGMSGIQTAGALPLASYYSESAFKNAEPILRKVVEAANDPNYKVLLPKIEETLSRAGVTLSELASRLAPTTLAATLMTYSPNAGDPNEIATVAEKFKTFTGYDPTETLRTEAPKIAQPKRPITPTPVTSSDVVTPIPSPEISSTELKQLPPENKPLLDLIAQKPLVPQPVTEVTAETPPAPITSPDQPILDLITPTTTPISKLAPYTPNISVAPTVVTPTVAPIVSPTKAPKVAPVIAPEIAPVVAPKIAPIVSPKPSTSPVTSPEVLPSSETSPALEPVARPALEPAPKNVIETPVSPVVSPVLVTPEPTPKPPVPLTDDEKIINLITPVTPKDTSNTLLDDLPVEKETPTPSEEVSKDVSKEEVPADKPYKPKITTKTVVTKKPPTSPVSVLSQALGTTGLTAYRGAGEIEDPSTGKKRRNVWNEETLRLKDALGV